jgi:hypothetical protein
LGCHSVGNRNRSPLNSEPYRSDRVKPPVHGNAVKLFLLCLSLHVSPESWPTRGDSVDEFDAVFNEGFEAFIVDR